MTDRLLIIMMVDEIFFLSVVMVSYCHPFEVEIHEKEKRLTTEV